MLTLTSGEALLVETASFPSLYVHSFAYKKSELKKKKPTICRGEDLVKIRQRRQINCPESGVVRQSSCFFKKNQN